MDWKQYEHQIADYFRSEYPAAQIKANAKVLGKFSKVERQVDLLIEETAADFFFRIAVDAKYRGRKIDVTDVEAFLGFLRDVGAHQGVMISTEGYSNAAINRAYFDDLDVDLDVLNFEDLKPFQGFSAIPYAGEHGVLMPAPFGWVIDAGRPAGLVAALYQRGLNFDRAVEASEWMYVDFWTRGEQMPNLQALLDYQEGYLRERFPDAVFEYLDPGIRKDAATKIRVLKTKSYPTAEYTGFVEFQRFMFFCVMFTPQKVEQKNLRKLRYVLRRVLPLGVKHAPPPSTAAPARSP